MTISLLQRLHVEHGAVAEFLALLDQEADAMAQGRFTDLPQLAQSKAQLADKIAIARRHRENEQMTLGFGLAWLLNQKFRGHATLTTIILLPMMLSPAVVGTFWTYFFQPQYGIFNYIVSVFSGTREFTMIGSTALAPWAIILVDSWMWTPYVMLLILAGLRSIPDYLYEAAEVDRASEWTKFWRITIPMLLPFLILALLFRFIENFKMFDLVNQLTSGGPGSVTELASITLKREAFEKWRTGYSAAFAIILFVSVYGLSNLLVRFLERVKER